MKFNLSAAVCAFVVLFSSIQTHAHGCPIQPDESLAYSLGVDAQMIWQYGPEVGSQSVLFIEIKKAGTAIPTDLALEPSVSIEASGNRNEIVIEPVLDEKGIPLPAEFKISNLNFPAPGKWKLNLQLKSADGTKETQTALVELCGRK